MATSEPEWALKLQNALESQPIPRLGQLSTIRGGESIYSGRPACRTIHIRKVERGRVYFVTDTRSGKYVDLTEGESCYGELCAYFPNADVQFRLSCTANIISQCDAAQTFWESMGEREKTFWTWPTPGVSWAGDEKFGERIPEQAPGHFCICELIPDMVEIFDQNEFPFRREMHVCDQETGKWSIERLNP